MLLLLINFNKLNELIRFLEQKWLDILIFQSFMQQIPRHFRALISHPRGGGAVLRIRNGAQNLARGNQNITSSPIRIGIARGIGGEQVFGQLLSQMVFYI
jgi:hypothetical protein